MMGDPLLTARGLPIEEAARYVGCENEAQFRREWQAGKWPDPLPIASRPKRWDRRALDKKLDEYSGLGGADETLEEEALEAIRRGPAVRHRAA